MTGAVSARGLGHPGWRRVWRALSAESAEDVATYIRQCAYAYGPAGREGVAYYLEHDFLSDVMDVDMFAPCVARDLRVAGLIKGED